MQVSVAAIVSLLGLEEREKRILQAWFVDELSLEEIGRRERLSLERVGQIVRGRMRAARRLLPRRPDWMALVEQGRALIGSVHSLEELAARLPGAWTEESLQGLKFLLRCFGELDFPRRPDPEPPAEGAIRDSILEAVADQPLGPTHLTAVLRGQDWKRLEAYRKLPWRGRLARCSEAEVRRQIVQLLATGRLSRSPWHVHGKVGNVLHLPRAS